MDSKTRENILKAIETLRENFRKHSNPDSWANNITTACKHLNSREEWVHFYHFLANPNAYNIDSIRIENTDEHNDDKDTWAKFTLDENLTPIVYKNGTECVIHLKNKNLYNDAPSCIPDSEDDDKKQQK